MANDRERSRSPRSSNNEEIVRLVVMREQARLAKDWGLADTIRERLTAAGVTLFDKTNAWRTADGRSGRIPTWSEIEAGQTAESIIQQQEQKTLTLGGDSSEANIKYLVQMREQARASKDWAQSDKIREDLKALGVEVFDKEKMWRAKSGQSGCIIGYRGSAGPTDLEISVLVVQRERARQSGDYGTADMIRDELKAVGCEILDKEKIWRSGDGRSGAVPSWSAIAGGAGGGDVLQPNLLAQPTPIQAGATLQNQVVQAALVASQNPATAARTLQILQQELGASTGVSLPVKNNFVLRQSPEAREALNFINQCQVSGRNVTDTEIDWLVGIREKLRQNKDFGDADTLRDAMRSSIGVELYEKEKRWVATDGRQGMIPMWTSLIV